MALCINLYSYANVHMATWYFNHSFLKIESNTVNDIDHTLKQFYINNCTGVTTCTKYFILQNLHTGHALTFMLTISIITQFLKKEVKIQLLLKSNDIHIFKNWLLNISHNFYQIWLMLIKHLSKLFQLLRRYNYCK